VWLAFFPLSCTPSSLSVRMCTWIRFLCHARKMPVAVPDGCLLVQAGKQLERLTGGHVLAGFHEVRPAARTHCTHRCQVVTCTREILSYRSVVCCFPRPVLTSPHPTSPHHSSRGMSPVAASIHGRACLEVKPERMRSCGSFFPMYRTRSVLACERPILTSHGLGGCVDTDRLRCPRRPSKPCGRGTKRASPCGEFLPRASDTLHPTRCFAR